MLLGILLISVTLHLRRSLYLHLESMQARRVFEYKCSTTFYAPKPFVPISVAHPSFIPWWQELHDHIFNVPVHPLCLELMPDFQPTLEVICSSPFLTSVFNHTPHY
jgi:hypothetical protein